MGLLRIAAGVVSIAVALLLGCAAATIAWHMASSSPAMSLVSIEVCGLVFEGWRIYMLVAILSLIAMGLALAGVFALSYSGS
jgi:hypothetical protein